MKAKFITTVYVVDPDFDGDVELSVFKHENGGIFAIDSSFLDQTLCDHEDKIPDPFNKGKLVKIIE